MSIVDIRTRRPDPVTRTSTTAPGRANPFSSMIHVAGTGNPPVPGRVGALVLIFLGLVLLVIQIVLLVRYGKSDDDPNRRKGLIVGTATLLVCAVLLFVTA